MVRRVVAFVSVRHGTRAIYELDLETRRERRLIGLPAHQPTYSPDGRLLLFHAPRDGRGRLHIADADGANVRPLDLPN